MRRLLTWLVTSFCGAALLAPIVHAAQTESLIFLSTQLRPIQEAQKMRNLILKDFSRPVDYITEQPQQLPARVAAEQTEGTYTIDVSARCTASWSRLCSVTSWSRSMSSPAAHRTRRPGRAADAR